MRASPTRSAVEHDHGGDADERRSRRAGGRSRGTPSPAPAGPDGMRTSVSSSSSSSDGGEVADRRSRRPATDPLAAPDRTTISAPVSDGDGGQLGRRRRRGRGCRRRCRGCGSRRDRSAASASASTGDRSRDERRPLGVALAGQSRRGERPSPSSARMPASSATLVDVDELRGRARRMASSGTRLWPPASTFASSPCSARSASASSTDRRRVVLERCGLHAGTARGARGCRDGGGAAPDLDAERLRARPRSRS